MRVTWCERFVIGAVFYNLPKKRPKNGYFDARADRAKILA
jgi:hypothetical protein